MLRIVIALISKWRYALPALGVAVIVILFGWKYHAWALERAEVRHQKELASYAEQLRAECARDKQITENVSREYQNTIANLSSRVAALKRVQPKTCVPVSTPEPSTGRDSAPGNAGLPKPYGVTTDALYDFAADAERVGLKFDACRNFIAEVWQAKQK